MTQHELDVYFRSFLNCDTFSAADPSKNGLQVANSGRQIDTVAFAVDACLESIRGAVRDGAQMLFVHHGLFWGDEQTITGMFYERIAALMRADIALYACHLPLDAHPEVGNNSVIVRRLGLQAVAPFCEWHGAVIGYSGLFPEAVLLDEVIAKLFPTGEKPSLVLPFGKKKVHKVAIVSGGGGSDLDQAIQAYADVFITGEIEHKQYHTALESGINVIAGGHYQTETGGVCAMSAKLAEEKGLRTTFIHVPTGM